MSETELKERKKTEPNPIKRFRAKPNSRTLAIAAMCSQCMGCDDDSIEKGFRGMIRDCANKNCALHSFRPFQSGEDDEAETDETPAPDPLAGWTVHPVNPDYCYRGQEVKLKADILAGK